MKSIFNSPVSLKAVLFVILLNLTITTNFNLLYSAVNDSTNNVDLSRATILILSRNAVINNAAKMLRDEVSYRTRIRLNIVSKLVDDQNPVIYIGTKDEIQNLSLKIPGNLNVPDTTDGYVIWTGKNDRNNFSVNLIGSDKRGALYAVGCLLKMLYMERDTILLNENILLASAPSYPLRGHQLGYRPKTNSYDAWTVDMWENYMRDLIVFGVNTIELIPPRSDDNDDSPNFKLPPLEMMIEMSKLADSYDLDVWIWYPVIDDELNKDALKKAIEERDRVFRNLPRLDAVFIPGGDPGNINPDKLFPLMKEQYQVLRKYHPDAKIWVSPQGFDWEGYPMEEKRKVEGKGWLKKFYQHLRKENNDWLGGVVYGPQISKSIKEIRENVPSRLPIRRYPDITHTLDSQYWIKDWDPALYATLYREPINPRPREYAEIFHKWDKYTCGFITYSEGINDDVNKCIWSSLGWDPELSVEKILREYSRYFINPHFEDKFSKGLLALEQNWQGKLLTNISVYETLRIFRDMEKSATPNDKLNWRFQSALYRAYYDAYIRRRLIHETEIEEETMDMLRHSDDIGTTIALNKAEDILDKTVTEIVAPDWRQRIYELAEALFQSIGLQLDVKKYFASAKRRGGNLEDIDEPVNDYINLKNAIKRIKKITCEEERLKAIHEITSNRFLMKKQFDYEVIQEGIN